MEKLIRGVRKFQEEIFPAQREHFRKLTHEGQSPDTLFITCADSRIDPSLIMQTQPGELFIIRNAGNIVAPYTATTSGESATIEYALTVLEVKHIVLCGHRHCGAMAYLVQHPEHATDPRLPMVNQWLNNADSVRTITEARCQDLDTDARIEYAIEANVKMQLQHLQTHPSVAKGLACKTLTLHGWVYDLEHGTIQEYCPATDSFVSLLDNYSVLSG